MLGRVIARMVVFALKSKKLSLEDKGLCTIALLDNLQALPLHNIIDFNEQGKLLINNKLLDYDKASQLRESAKGMLNNQARRVVLDQVRWLSVDMGINQALSPEHMIFVKAALWHDQKEEELYRLLAGEEA